MDWNNATEYCNSFDMFLAYFDNQSELDEYFRLSRIVTRDIQQRWIDGTSQGRRRLDYLFKVKIKLSEEALISLRVKSLLHGEPTSQQVNTGARLKNASLFTPLLVGKTKLQMI